MSRRIRQAISSIVFVSLLLEPCGSVGWAQTTSAPEVQQGGADVVTGLSFRERAVTPRTPRTPPRPGLVGGGASGGGALGGGVLGSTGEGLLQSVLYQVHVLGEVAFPGTYRITASSRMAEVLEVAGGISQLGSERRVELRRTGEQTRAYDLLRFKTFAELSQNPYVQENDVIFVPLRASTIRIVGAVKRPGEYEIIGEKTIRDAIRLADGFSVGALLEQKVHVARFDESNRKIIKLDPASDEWKTFKIRGGDVIYVPNVITKKNQFDFGLQKLPGDNIFYPSFEDRVFVVGAVNDAGAYPFTPHHTIPQYISLAGGKTIMAKKKLYVISPDGTRKKVNPKREAEFTINPGDTIIIPEKRLDSQGWLTLFMTVTNFTTGMIFSIIALARL